MSNNFRLDKRHLLIYVAAMVDPLLITSYIPLVPVLKTTFNTNIELVALSLTFHMLPFALLNLFSGIFSDLNSRPKILFYGLLISATGSILGGFSPTILVFFLSRVIQGIGSAFIFPVALALMGDIIPKGNIGKAMGIWGAFMGIATTFGPLIGGYIAGISWRLLPFILSLYCLISTVFIKNVFSFKTENKSKINFNILLRQYKYATRNKNLIIASIFGFILFFTFQGIQPIISDLLSIQPFSVKPADIGFMFSIIGLTGILFSFFSGGMIDKIGSRKTVFLSFLIMLIPQFGLLYANSFLTILILLSVLGGFQKIAFNTVNAIGLESMPSARGSASSIFNFSRYLGYAVAPSIFAILYSAQGTSILYSLNLFLFLTSLLLSHFLQR